MGKVYLVGAGPGDSELISLRGYRLVKNCDVLIYDRLVAQVIIDVAKSDCEKIYVGKSPNNHSLKQEEINKIIVDKAEENKIIVRLKGGDPFVFGRGGEEVLALEKNEIDYEVIPGITSAIAVPEIAGIPVTHRGISQDLHIVTGHTAEINLTDYEALAKAKGTLVFLMGVHNVERISSNLIRYGKEKSTPVAIIEKGSTQYEKRIDTTLEDIVRDIKGVEPPAIIVVGEVAKFNMKSKVKRKSVALTGTEDFRNRLQDKLINRDYIVKERCILNTQNNEVDFDINDFDWLVFAGRNGVRIFMEQLSKKKVDIRKIKNKIAVIGKGTYDALAEYGIYADYMPNVYTSRELGIGLNEVAGNEFKLLFRAEKGSDEIYEYINNYKDVRLYSVKEIATSQCEEDYIVFGSSLGVRTYLKEHSISDKTKIVAIGDITSKTLINMGYSDILVCKEASVDSIVKMIEDN